jgi:pimeloyl-ACP methyl ester carboxylesterase
MMNKPVFSGFIKINGHNLYVESYGPDGANPIVFLHHGLGSTKSWKGQIFPFLEAGYRLILYDRWGYGLSDGRESLSIPTFSDDIADLDGVISSLKLRSVVLVGHSDGGTIALIAASRNRQEIAGLVCIAAHVYVEAKMKTGINGVRTAFIEDQNFQEGLRRAHGEKYTSVFFNWFDGWHKESNLNWDFCSELQQIHCPVLVIQGLEDEHATPAHAQNIARSISGSELWLAPGSGHMLPQENFDVFNTRVISFLASIRVRSSA